MANFSITEAALTGFRVVRERPVAVLGWAALQFVLMAASFLVLISVAGPAMTQMQTHGLPTDQNGLVALMSQVERGEPPMLGLSLVCGALLSAAMNRAVMAPQDRSFAFLKLGRDELAQLGLRMLLLLLWIAANLLLVALAQGLAAIGGMFGAGGQAVAGLSGLAASVAAVICVVYVSLRLSLASAATFARHRIDLRTSWEMTRGHVAEIFGAFCLALVLAGLVLALGMTIVVLVTSAVVGIIDPANTMRPDLSSIAGLLKPAPLIMLGLMSALFGLMSPLLLTPGAFIYQRLTGSMRQGEPASKSDLYA